MNIMRDESSADVKSVPDWLPSTLPTSDLQLCELWTEATVGSPLWDGIGQTVSFRSWRSDPFI
jgi:hypothetical protein